MWTQEQYEEDRFTDYSYGLDECQVDAIEEHLSDAFECLGVVDENNEELYIALKRIADIIGFSPRGAK